MIRVYAGELGSLCHIMKIPETPTQVTKWQKAQILLK